MPIVEAPAEGEAQAAHIVRRGDADYVGSEDYDALLFGAPRTLRQLTSKGDPELMDLEATLAHHDLTLEQLIDAAILIGTDFNEGVRGIGPKTAISEITEHGDLWSVLEARGDSVEYGDRVRQLFRDPNVTDDYEFDTTLDPGSVWDSDSAGDCSSCFSLGAPVSLSAFGSSVNCVNSDSSETSEI